ncbi:MAG: hypothetical protein PHF86_07910 [Candidatus Nanoarchaeia archaeon]|jgi:hypothetical protein|nr:hypothetical protein [Candidatus Nanoarchaeia archaeon]
MNQNQDSKSSNISDKQAISIISTALLRIIDIASNGRIDSCKSVGLVHTTVSKHDDSLKTWVIKFDVESCAVGIDPIETDKFPDGTILYYHDDKGDTFTQAALFGDGVTDLT